MLFSPYLQSAKCTVKYISDLEFVNKKRYYMIAKSILSIINEKLIKL